MMRTSPLLVWPLASVALSLVAACPAVMSVDSDADLPAVADASADAPARMDSNARDSDSEDAARPHDASVLTDATIPNDAAQPEDATASDAAADSEDAATSTDATVPMDATSRDAAGAPCSPEGAIRRLRCECLASRTEVCRGGVWVPDTPCDYECEPGTMSTHTPRDCSVYTQTCGADCRWGARVYEVPPGECARGTRSCGFPYGNCICTDECICMIDPDCPL